jgi:methylated-DNA-protein-cysteine methyltransferase-like protein
MADRRTASRRAGAEQGLCGVGSMMSKSMSPFSERAVTVIRQIPRGRVATYRQIAGCAGNHLAARRVAWLLHSSARKYRLPWQRVVGSNGRVSLKPGYGYEEQRRLLRLEGVGFRRDGSIDLERYLWRPSVRGPAPGGSRRSKRGDRPA